MIIAMIIVFILGYALIALEHSTGINKTAIALILGIVLWGMYLFSGPETVINTDPASFHHFIEQNPDDASLSTIRQVKKYITNLKMIEQLGNVAEILFYLLGALTIVKVIDVYQGFSGITSKIHAKNKIKLLWLVAFVTFFMSSVLDNMTSAIIMIIFMQKLSDNQRERWIFGSIVIIAANAGGAWTPIGDITTIMLWINDNITSGHIMKTLFLPSIISLALPVWIISFALNKQQLPSATSPIVNQSAPPGSGRQTRILLTGVLCLLAVPVIKSVTGLPPFAGILFSLGWFWIYIDKLHNRNKTIPPGQRHPIPEILSKIDFSTILFFLGILMAVAALESAGILKNLSNYLDINVHNVYLISIIIGFLSSVIDNVPLVAATIGMYPVVPAQSVVLSENSYMLHFVKDGTFWDLIAYCAGTGGSILVIGSAAGIVVMGLEKINFMWYMKNISWIATTGFLAGIGVYYLQMQIG